MKLQNALLAKIVDELRNGNDRACAVVAGSLLEFQLERLLSAHLIPSKVSLFGSQQPLATFSGRIAISNALGLIPGDIFHDLTCIRKIRNEFSHQFETTTFESMPVRNHAMNLLTTQWLIDHQHLGDIPIIEPEIQDISGRPRRRFEIAVAIVSVAIDSLITMITPCATPSYFLPSAIATPPIA